MKIGVTGLRGLPGVMGGIESHCEELYPRLKTLRPDDDFTIIARSPYVPAMPAPFRGIAIVPVYTVRNKYLETILNTFLGLLVARFRLGVDLIHIHGIGPAILAPLARLLGLKLIVTHHGEDFNRVKWNGPAKFVLRAGEWCAIHSAVRLIVVSDTLAQDLRRRHPRRAARIAFVPNGASLLPTTLAPGDSPEAILSRLGLTRGGYVLGVGRLVPEKGFDDLVAAVERTAGRVKLVIAGAADHQDQYARDLLARASDHIVFAGFQPHAVLRVLYENAALFVLPSYHEGLPIAALEAAAVGTPMLLSDVPPNREIGLAPNCYFPVGNVAALADKLVQDFLAYAVDSRAVTERFDWDKVAAETSRIYAEVAG